MQVNLTKYVQEQCLHFDGSTNNDNKSREDFKLLAYFSSIFENQTFIAVGTIPRETILALSHNTTNTVIPYLTTDPEIFNEQNKLEILNSALIYVDIHPHQGNDEYTIYSILRDWGYKGIILFDDIWYFKEMRDNCWYQIPDEYKYDATDYGHWSGTGIVSFDPNFIYSILPAKQTTDNWTLVTAYFNLTKCPDASDEIRQRDKAYYFQHSISTLSLPNNLVIFCDKESFSQIVQIRPQPLAKKTQYIICEFDDFQFVDVIREKGDETNSNKRQNATFADYRNMIRENRIRNPYAFDPRNTPSYYLFCMARYIMLKRVIKHNLFKSTHFAWINFCMERMGISNIRRLPEALSLNREKFSTCYIDYIPEIYVKNTKEYFKRGLCSMCSGFFTGNAEYMFRVCDLIENKFLQYVDEGYGHSDETLFPTVYFDNVDLFEHYYGDYTEMITNYAYVYENGQAPIQNFIRNSFELGDYARCFKASTVLWNSYKLGKCQLTVEQLEKLCYYYMVSNKETN
jgi:hypothetical protein